MLKYRRMCYLLGGFRTASIYRFCILSLFFALSLPAQTIITTLAGSRFVFPPDGLPALSAPIGTVSGVTADSSGNIYFSDLATDRVYRIDTKGFLTTYAGSGTQGYAGDGGPATSAALFNPRSLVFDGSGNLYISDAGNSRIRKVTPAGVISTVAGNGITGFSGDGGLATAASFGSSARIALDPAGNLYISDPDNHRIRRVAANGTIFTLAGNGSNASSGDNGSAQLASLQTPAAMVIDSAGNLYVADYQAARVRRITPGGIISTVAGTGIEGESGDGGAATQAHLWGPTGLAIDSTNSLYIADQFGGRIRKLDLSSGIITTIAGTVQNGMAGDGGPAVSASLYAPTDLFAAGSSLLIADSGNFRVRSIARGTITTIAGNGNYGYTGDGGISGRANLPAPDGVVVDPAGNIDICDSFANRVRSISTYGIINVTAGANTAGYSGDGGKAINATAADCRGMAVDRGGNLYFADTHNRRIRKIDTSGIITTVAGNGTNGFSGDGSLAINAELSNPEGVAVDSQGNLYIADTGNNRIRRVSAAGIITTVAGTGAPGLSPDGIAASGALLNSPSRVAVDPSGNIYFSDNGNNVVRRISSVGFIFTVAGNGQYGFSGDGGPAASAMLANPLGIAIDTTGGILIADADNRRIRRVDPNGTIATIAGNGTPTLTGDGRPPLSTGFGSPADVAVDPSGNIYIADQNDGRVRRIQPKPSSIVLSETGVAFTAAVDAASVTSRTVRIVNGGAGTIGWSASATTLSGGSQWLSVTPAQGSATNTSTDSAITISVNPAGLASGNYYGQVQVASPGVANSPRFITVVLNILSATQTTGPSVSPAGFLFTAPVGSSIPPAQTLTVSILHGTSVPFTSSITYTDSNKWLTVTPSSSTVSAAKPAVLTLQTASQGLPAGVYTATLNLAFPNSNRSIPVTLAVTATTTLSARTITRPRAATCTPTQLLPTVTALAQNFTVAAGWPAPMEATVLDDCGQPLTGGSVVATFSNGDPPLLMSALQDGTWSATWSPRGQANVAITINAQSSSQSPPVLHGSVQFNGQVTPNAEPPIINSGGVLNSASFAAGEPSTPGALISVFGANLASKPAAATSLPLPTQLAGSQVLIGGIPMPLLYAGPGQINAVVPYPTPVNTTQQVIVISGNTISVPEPNDVAPGAPATFTLDGSGGGAGIVVAVNPDRTAYIVSTAKPAHPGSVIVIYCTGLGAVQSAIHAGDAAPLAPIAPVTEAVSLAVGGEPVPILFAGLVPTLSGLYQINAQLPADVPTGDAVPVVLNAVGLAGPPVTIAIH